MEANCGFRRFAVLFGTPSRYGNVASQLRQLLELLGPRQWERPAAGDAEAVALDHLAERVVRIAGKLKS
jgi:multimeric flavodoxin WrbA